MTRRMISDILVGRTLFTASKETTVRAASRVMAEKRIGALLIVEGKRIVGIFTERDALNKVLAAGLDADKTSLANLVADPQTIGRQAVAYACTCGRCFRMPVAPMMANRSACSARAMRWSGHVQVEREIDHLEEPRLDRL